MRDEFGGKIGLEKIEFEWNRTRSVRYFSKTMQRTARITKNTVLACS